MKWLKNALFICRESGLRIEEIIDGGAIATKPYQRPDSH